MGSRQPASNLAYLRPVLNTGTLDAGPRTMAPVGFDDGGGGGMDGRIERLEDSMTDVKVSLGKIETRLDHIENSMLTKGAAAMYAMSTIIAGSAAMLAVGWWVVEQYLAPILARLPTP